MRKKIYIIKKNQIEIEKKRYNTLYEMIFITILIITISTCSVIYIICNNYQNNKVQLQDEVSTIVEKNYNIQINTPETSNNEYVDNIVNDYVNNEVEIYKEQVTNTEISNLTIDVSTNRIGNIETIYKKEISNIDNNINTTYLINYYNLENNTEITMENIYTNKDGYYTKLIWYTKWYISKHPEISLLEDLSPLDNYENYNLIFNESEIFILFKAGTISTEDIIIPCPYTALKTYTNEETLNLNNMVIKKVENKDATYYSTKKLIAFTFDDGPVGKNTNLLLDELAKRNYKVTFFVVGNLAATYPDVIKREYEEGHTVGTHTWNHTYLSRLKTTYAIQDMVYSANNKVQEITGVAPTFFRPPGGIRNKTILDAIDMPFILWSLDTEDWRKKNTELDAIAAVEGAKEGDIVLFHDLHAPSIPAAIQAMDILAYDNYEFVSLDQMATLKSFNFEQHNLYWSVR